MVRPRRFIEEEGQGFGALLMKEGTAIRRPPHPRLKGYENKIARNCHRLVATKDKGLVTVSIHNIGAGN